MKTFIIFWERIANSGIARIEAKSASEAIEKLGFNPKFCKLSAFEIAKDCEALTIGEAR